MKKHFWAIICFLIFAISLVFISCDTEKTPSTDNTQKDNSPLPTHNIYIDNPQITVNKISMKFSCSESSIFGSAENKKLKITLTCTNTEATEKTFNPTNAQIIHEEANAVYTMSINPSQSKNLKYGIDNTFTFSVQIPESYKDTNYTFSFETREEKYTLFLYETPEELRNDCTVQFKIGTETVKTIHIKERKKLPETYIWEDPNHLYHCDSWYTDENFKTKFSIETPITKDIVLYGMRTNNLKSHKDSSGFFITSITYVPSDGILIIDSFFANEKVFISNYAICRNNQIKEIYLPKDLKKIYYGNFNNTPNLEKIHYAGTQEEWELVSNMSSIPKNTIIVFNSEFQER